MADEPRTEERKQLMKRESFISTYSDLANFHDPLKKREEFSISLRKKKKQEIIKSKRKRAGWESFQMDSPSGRD